MYSSSSEWERGYILDSHSDNNIISVKILLTIPFTEACIDITSTPLSEDSFLISIPHWNLSFIYEFSKPHQYYFDLFCENNNTLPYAELLLVTIDVIHNYIDSFNDNQIKDNNLITVPCLVPELCLNQYLPF